MLRAETLHEKEEANRIGYRRLGPRRRAATPDVVIGISPAFGLKLFQTTAGHRLSDVSQRMSRAIEKAGAGADRAHAPYSRHLVPGSQRGTACGLRRRHRHSGEGHGGHSQKDRLPHNNLELFSNAPITTLDHYRRMGANAAAYALGELPEPVVVPTRGEAMGSRYHARVSLIYAIETEMTAEGATPEEVEVTLTGASP